MVVGNKNQTYREHLVPSNPTTNGFVLGAPVQNKKMKACNFQTEANIDHSIFVQPLRKQSFKGTILQGIAQSFVSNRVQELGMANILSNSVAVLNAKSLGGRMTNVKAFNGKASG